ncbi:MAG TPA: lysophospholipid acyltransferase family protein [Burkholderiaceae bacterium]
MALVTIPWATLSILCFMLPYSWRYYITVRWNFFCIWLAKVLCGIRYQVKGMENLPDGPAILLSKHQSAWETIFLICLMPRPLVYVFKRELMLVPFFGWALGMLRMVPIDRSKGKDAFASVVREGRKRLDQGLWIIMFPEGTRTRPGSQGKYKAGGARLAIETKTPVVPIALNSGECWGKNSFVKKPGLITVSIGKTMTPAENEEPTALVQKVENWIESEMRVISPHLYKDSGTSDATSTTQAST